MRRDEPRLYKVGRIWKTWVYVGGRRRKVSTGKRTRAAALVVARQLEEAAADPARAIQEATTVEDALWESLQNLRERVKAGDRSEDTVSMYRKKNGQLVRLLGADTPLATFRHSAPLDAYVSARRREQVKDATIYKEMVVMRSALKLAKRRGLWTGDLDAVLPQLSPKYVPRRTTITAANFDQLLVEMLPDDAARAAFIIATGAELRATVLAERSDISPGFCQLRGTKRATRFRQVPIVLSWQRSLLAYALEQSARSSNGKDAGPSLREHGFNSRAGRQHAGVAPVAERRAEVPRVAGSIPASGTLFRKSADEFRWALRYAARRAGIPHVTPNDLRRTYATELHAAGARLATLAPTMGHADTRMLERVYAVLPPALLAERLQVELGVNRDTIGTDASRFNATPATGETAAPSEKVPRGGIEPPTRGFSVHGPTWPSPMETRSFSASERSHRDRFGTVVSRLRRLR
jgi:integrase